MVDRSHKLNYEQTEHIATNAVITVRTVSAWSTRFIRGAELRNSSAPAAMERSVVQMHG